MQATSSASHAQERGAFWAGLSQCQSSRLHETSHLQNVDGNPPQVKPAVAASRNRPAYSQLRNPTYTTYMMVTWWKGMPRVQATTRCTASNVAVEVLMAVLIVIYDSKCDIHSCTWWKGMPRVEATTRCTASTLCVAECTVMLPPSSGTATAACAKDLQP